ncbi:MAG: sigma-70 family RNA polymerase sigma factor [Muribaculaceae bacterium]|nr:sigma-70 family RNA polymerase sigma factor [Muribaculaceae bacterium]
MTISINRPLSLTDLMRFKFVTESASTADFSDREASFLTLLNKHESLISAICFSYSSSVAEFDDLRQDAIINLWRGLPSFKAESSSRTWIYRVVLNSCVSTIRKQARHSKANESLEGLYDILADDQPEDRERIEILHSMIASLNPQDKAIILLWLDDASYDEISSVMGIPRNTVASRLHRIKERLRRKAESEEL